MEADEITRQLKALRGDLFKILEFWDRMDVGRDQRPLDLMWCQMNLTASAVHVANAVLKIIEEADRKDGRA